MPVTRMPEFDDAVRRAMVKWPDVPHCFGWLRLDCRGYWRIRDEVITHARSIQFLNRHYRDDEQGRWFIQNGPQRVFVALDYTPWIYHYDSHAGFTSHTGLSANDISAAIADDDGNLLLQTGLGIGLVDDRDLAAVAEFIEDAAGTGEHFDFRGESFSITSVAREMVATLNQFVAQPESS